MTRSSESAHQGGGRLVGVGGGAPATEGALAVAEAEQRIGGAGGIAADVAQPARRLEQRHGAIGAPLAPFELGERDQRVGLRVDAFGALAREPERLEQRPRRRRVVAGERFARLAPLRLQVHSTHVRTHFHHNPSWP